MGRGRGQGIRYLGIMGVLALAVAVPASRGFAAAAAPHHTVVLTVDNTLVSATLTPVQAIARAQHYATAFHLRAPRSVPRGVLLQGINVTSFGGNFAFATISLDYAGPGGRAFSLSESKVHVSTSYGKHSRTWAVRIGKAAGTLIETTGTHQHAFDLAWFSTTGYDLRTLGASTQLNRTDLLRIAASV